MAAATVPGGNAPGGKPQGRPTVVITPDPLPEMMAGTMPRITVHLENTQTGKIYKISLTVEGLKTDVNGEDGTATENSRADRSNRQHAVFILTPEADGEATIHIFSPDDEFDEVRLQTPPIMSPPGMAPTPAPVPSRSPQAQAAPPPIASTTTVAPGGSAPGSSPTLTPAPAAGGSAPASIPAAVAAPPAPRARTAAHNVPPAFPLPQTPAASATATTPTNPPRTNAPAVPPSNRTTKMAGMILATILAIAAVVIVLGVVYKLRHPEEVATNTAIIPETDIPIADATPGEPAQVPPTPLPAPVTTAEPAPPTAPPEPETAEVAPPVPEPVAVAPAPEPAPPVAPAPSTSLPGPTLPCAPYKNVLVKNGQWSILCQDGTTELTCPDAKSVPGGLDLGVCRP